MPRKTLIAALIAITAGCSSESPDARLTRVTEQALTEQAAQNQRMAELEQDVQSRSIEIDQQRDDLEQQRQELAQARIREPLIANSLLSATTLLVAALPLVAAVLLLFQLLRQPPSADVSELLVDELATGRLRMAAQSALTEQSFGAAGTPRARDSPTLETPTMPLYEVEQYELWTQTYRISAEDAVSAVLQVLRGEATPLDNSLELIEPDDSRGLPIDELGDDVEVMFARADCQQWLTDGEIVDSIRRVVEVGCEAEPGEHPAAPAASADL